MASIVVSDAGPLISLGRLDLLALLPKLFVQVQVPTAVLDECMARPDNADTLRIQAALDQNLLVACDAEPIVRDGLDPGECAAIGRAIQIGAGLLADDHAARQCALELGLGVLDGGLAGEHGPEDLVLVRHQNPLRSMSSSTLGVLAHGSGSVVESSSSFQCSPLSQVVGFLVYSGCLPLARWLAM